MRALSGLVPKAPLRGKEIWPSGWRGGHGLIVVGSHVSHTSRQVAGQLFPGVISVFRPIDAAPGAMGAPMATPLARSGHGMSW